MYGLSYIELSAQLVKEACDKCLREQILSEEEENAVYMLRSLADNFVYPEQYKAIFVTALDFQLIKNYYDR